MDELGWTAEDDAALIFASTDEAHPVMRTFQAWKAIKDASSGQATLAAILTPESNLDARTVARLRGEMSARELGISSVARRHAESNDVAYVIVTEGGDPARVLEGAEVVQVAYVFTWVWRPELGGWRLHAIGTGPHEPNTLPRTSPGDAPDIGSEEPHFI